MTDETTDTSTSPDPAAAQAAIEARAKRMGWIPEHEFRGDKSKWRPADQYLQRGEEMLPILQANNRDLLNTVDTLRGQLNQTQATLREATESIQALKEFNSNANLAMVKGQRDTVISQLAEAKEEKDYTQEAQLTNQLTELNVAIKDAEKKPEPKPASSAHSSGNGNGEGAPSPEMKAWMSANPWFGVDHRKTGLANGIANELRAEGVTSIGKAFLDAMNERLEQALSDQSAPVRRVESSTNGGSGNGGGSRSNSRTKSFAQLPQDAKEACDRMAMRMVGGPTSGRAYKDKAEWQTAYATKYWEQNPEG